MSTTMEMTPLSYQQPQNNVYSNCSLGGTITCQNIQHIKQEENSCFDSKLLLLFEFFITKDGCQSGFLGSFRKTRMIHYQKNNEGQYKYIYFETEKKGSNSVDLKFNEVKLLNGLQLIAKKTPFVSFEQLKLIRSYIQNFSMNTKDYTVFYMGILNILLYESPISKLIPKLGLSPMKNLKDAFYKITRENPIQITSTYTGVPETLQIQQDMNLVNKLFKLYNTICFDAYHIYSLQESNMFVGRNAGNIITLLLSNVNEVIMYLVGLTPQTAGKKKKTSSLSEKTVDQLRSMMKKHGKKCSKDGKRLTKDQLIRVLKRF